MKLEWNKEFFQKLEAIMGRITEQTMLNETKPDHYVLQNVFTLQTEEKALVLTEASMFQIREDVVQLEINMVLDIEVMLETMGELEKAILNMNYYLPLGALGIFYPGNKLFHRYVAIVDDTKSPEAAANEIFIIYEMLGGAIGGIVSALKQIAAGAMTYKEALEQRLLLEQK